MTYFDIVNKGMYTKDIVFCIPGMLRVGAQGAYVSFPFKGNIVGLKNFCVEPGTEDTKFQIHKISKEDFEAQADTWENITEGDIIIPAGDRLALPAELSVSKVQEGDYFRVYVLYSGVGLQNLTVQISITIH